MKMCTLWDKMCALQDKNIPVLKEKRDLKSSHSRGEALFNSVQFYIY